MIKIIKGDITKMEVDAIVNAANTTLLGGGGVDGAIHRAAGAELKAECLTLGGCKTGEAKITKGYRLFAKYVIHTVGPDIREGLGNERDALACAYRNSLELAKTHEIKTIAFPCISTGIFGYPFEAACEVALNTITEFLRVNTAIEKVYLVCFSNNDYERYLRILEESRKEEGVADG
jgi:O-acetyl-ADP-ribose deacetylase (regulator of RNase III)